MAPSRLPGSPRILHLFAGKEAETVRDVEGLHPTLKDLARKGSGASGAFRLIQPPSSRASGAMPIYSTGTASGASRAKLSSGSPCAMYHY